jgi:hypothetical protein
MAFNEILIAPTVNEITSQQFSAFGQANVSIQCNGLGAGETLVLQVYDISLHPNADWVNYLFNGSTVQLDNQNSTLTFALDVLKYRVVKSVTANPVGVAITSTNNLQLGGA